MRNLLVESQINPNFPVSADLKRCMDDFLFVERTRKGRQCKCFIWVTNLGTIHGEMLSNFSCPYRKSKLKHYRQSAFKQHNRKASKNSCKPADFRKTLQFTCGYIWAVKNWAAIPMNCSEIDHNSFAMVFPSLIAFRSQRLQVLNRCNTSSLNHTQRKSIVTYKIYFHHSIRSQMSDQSLFSV